MKTATITNSSTGTVIGDQIEWADTSLTRLVGLLGRHGLAAGGGIWIRPSSGIHTFGMRFSIDAVGLDAGLRVVKLWPHVKPHRISSLSMKVRSVLELAAGEISARSIGLGHVLNVVQHQELCFPFGTLQIHPGNRRTTLITHPKRT